MLGNNVFITIIYVLYFVVGITLILIVTLQPPRGEGLGAIGGSAQMFKGKDPVRRLMDKVIMSLGAFLVALTIFLVVITL